ncbi:MAG: type II secretion system protein, partial [Bdellovibrionales bacterium]
MTLTELILVIGILSVVVLSSSTLISQFMSSHQLIQTRDEVNEFGSALSKYFSLKDQCRSSLG